MRASAGFSPQGHELTVSDGFSGRAMFNAEKADPSWQRRHRQVWFSQASSAATMNFRSEFMELRCGALLPWFVLRFLGL